MTPAVVAKREVAACHFGVECALPEPWSQRCELVSPHPSLHPSWPCTDGQQNSPAGPGHTSLGGGGTREHETVTFCGITWRPLKEQR